MLTSFIPLKISEKEALKIASSERKGIFKKEKVDSISLLWIPAAILKIRFSYREKFVQDRIIREENWNVYELLKGWWTGLSFSHIPELGENLDVANLGEKFEPRIKVENVVNFVNSLKFVKNPVRLASYGIPVNSVDVEVLEQLEAYYPFYVAVLTSKKGRRLVSISGFSGKRCAIIEKLVEEIEVK